MSIENFLGDVFSGNFSNAFKRLEDWWAGMPTWLKDFVAKAESDAGVILDGLAQTAASDILSGGISTASFVAAAKDVEGKLVSQGLAFTQQEIFAAINLAVNALNQKTVTEDPTPAATDTAAASSATAG